MILTIRALQHLAIDGYQLACVYTGAEKDFEGLLDKVPHALLKKEIHGLAVQDNHLTIYLSCPKDE